VKEFLVYTGLRILLFVGSLAIVMGVWWLFGDVNLLWALLIAFVVSGLASWRLLNPHRERLARVVEERAGRAAERFEKARAAEDDDTRDTTS
jgi:hypothetical protein